MKIFRRTLFVFSFLILFSVSINAYTLVMRGGRHIEIPNNFIVTTAGVTYEVSKGISVTVQLTNIDVKATEKANNEPDGSFLARIGRIEQTSKQETQIQTQSQQRPTKTITNTDLNAYASERERAETEYEKIRVAKGFPSREEIQKRNEEDLKKLREISEKQAQKEAQDEAYWRGRANALRTEIIALDAEMAYVRARISEEPTYTVVYSFVPSQNFNTNPSPVVEPSANSQRSFGVSGTANFGGGQTWGSVGFYYPQSSVTFYPNNGIDVYGFYPFGYGFAPPFPVRYQSFNRAQLVTRLQILEQARVGLSARWRMLEEEARRAGAMPGWLR